MGDRTQRVGPGDADGDRHADHHRRVDARRAGQEPPLLAADPPGTAMSWCLVSGLLIAAATVKLLKPKDRSFSYVATFSTDYRANSGWMRRA